MTTEIQHRRFAAIGLSLTAIGMTVLFASHPSPVNGDFRELMQAEVREQIRSLAVHGGFILVEALSLTSVLMLARVYADASARVTAACVALSVGAAALALSMTVDGIVVPSLAARYLEATPGNEAEGIRGSLVLCSALIGALMPVGFVFQALSIASWSFVFVRIPGWPTFIGVASLFASVAMIVIAMVSRLHLPGHAIFGAIATIILWHLAAAAVAVKLPRKR